MGRKLTFLQLAIIYSHASDYSQGNVLLLPSLFPVIATELTTCCHRIYQLGDKK